MCIRLIDIVSGSSCCQLVVLSNISITFWAPLCLFLIIPESRASNVSESGARSRSYRDDWRPLSQIPALVIPRWGLDYSTGHPGAAGKKYTGHYSYERQWIFCGWRNMFTWTIPDFWKPRTDHFLSFVFVHWSIRHHWKRHNDCFNFEVKDIHIFI